MTPRAIGLVRHSFSHVLSIPDQAAACFYARLFQLAPGTRALFTSDMEAQGRKLIQTLAAVVESLDRLETILPTVRALAVRHVEYGVRDDYYELTGLALIETLRVLLGPEFNGETEAAWREAYALIATTMIAAAGEARAD